MVFILRPNGGHVDGFACFGVQTSSAEPPNNLTGMVLCNFKHIEHDCTYRACKKYVVIYQLPETFSNLEIILIFISLGCCFKGLTPHVDYISHFLPFTIHWHNSVLIYHL